MQGRRFVGVPNFLTHVHTPSAVCCSKSKLPAVHISVQCHDMRAAWMPCTYACTCLALHQPGTAGTHALSPISLRVSRCNLLLRPMLKMPRVNSPRLSWAQRCSASTCLLLWSCELPCPRCRQALHAVWRNRPAARLRSPAPTVRPKPRGLVCAYEDLRSWLNVLRTCRDRFALVTMALYRSKSVIAARAFLRSSFLPHAVSANLPSTPARDRKETPSVTAQAGMQMLATGTLICCNGPVL